MHVLLLGGTGSIGSAILDELIAHGHQVTALARSERSAVRLGEAGAEPLPGDLARPRDWAGFVTGADAVIQAAADFDSDMGGIDRAVLEAISSAASVRDTPLRLIYTGGCWLFGETGSGVADEKTPYDPLPSFAWMLENWRWLSGARGIAPILIHPAMVWDEDGGVLHRYVDAARKGNPIEIWGSPDATWPLVHRRDLASAYRLALESAPAGETYCVASEEGVTTVSLADAVAHHFGSAAQHSVLPVAEAVARHGDWAAGPALIQRMSSRKIRRNLGWTPRRTDCIALFSGTI
ncbi:NAD-dependent epimerase/dehydratase family protein [Nisaea acidiphila]|uniref:NAD-dependent epimerase/dehydratase family protein n=1 Tax=Nisaea acidiphila TaxID=1862145 RepID=A0A9J7AU11_9PROT|nr:NAD-dependent epimerase/dehydratase family protein [Nisaea acidiphila]UUX49804.1 NAD-dependent epimerase/dehydratase family protein [Nisaea acidiphila]